MTDYREKVDLLTNYYAQAEFQESERKLGMEIEHFLLKHPSLRAVSFSEPDGVEDLLTSLAEGDWIAKEEKGHVVGLESEQARVNLEPGAQIELTILPQDSIENLELIYLDFVKEVNSILNEQETSLFCVGYQPETSVEEIPLIPKERYRYMYDYFRSKGRYAHNMMKGTAAVHVSLDYYREKDYVKKNLVANALAPVVYTALDNSPFFEGSVYEGNGLRHKIWDNCDPDRSGRPPGVFGGRFGYKEYAEYILNVAPMVYKRGGELIYSKEKLLQDILLEELEPDKSELEYLLTTVFPDVRTKNHLEIRMGDSLPYPYSMAYVAFWKGLLYDRENLNLLFNLYKNLTEEKFLKYSSELYRGGRNTIWDSGGTILGYEDLLELAGRGLTAGEKKYLDPLQDLAERKLRPKENTLGHLQEGKTAALSWCNMNEVRGGLD